MTMALPRFDEAAFHKKQRSRLCNSDSAQPFTGKWAKRLTEELRDQLPDEMGEGSDRSDVVRCFADTPVERVELLFHALNIACAAGQDMDEAAVFWAAELTCYAAMRCIDSSYWLERSSSAPLGQGNAIVALVPTSSELIASVGLAGLRGLTLRFGSHGGPEGVIDLSGPTWGTELVEVLMARLYDHPQMVKAGLKPRLNPDSALTQDEKGRLREVFATARLKKRFWAPFIVLPPMGCTEADDFAQRLAEAIDGQVVVGDGTHDDRLVLGRLTVGDLKAKIENILQLLPYFVAQPAGAPSSAPAKPLPTPTAAATPLSSRPAYTWDLFISHASEDKSIFVDALAKGLQAFGLKVWYDAQQLNTGDSIRRKIDDGLRESRFIVVVLSSSFIAKGWTGGELDAALNLENSTLETRVLPVWFNVTATEVSKHSPLLAGKLAVQAQGTDDLTRVILSLATAVNAAT